MTSRCDAPVILTVSDTQEENFKTFQSKHVDEPKMFYTRIGETWLSHVFIGGHVMLNKEGVVGSISLILLVFVCSMFTIRSAL